MLIIRCLRHGTYLRVVPLFAILVAQWLGTQLPAWADPTAEAENSPGIDHLTRPHAWYFFIAAVNVYPQLESEDLVYDILEPVLEGLSPGHRGVRTIGDLRDDHLLWPPHLGLGYNLSEHWSVFLEAGYTSGKVRTKVDRPSIILLPLHTDFEIQRSALFAGIGLDYFPWKMPEQREYGGLADRLGGARPFLGTRLTWTYATYDAKVKLGIQPLPNFVNLEFSDAWALPSVTLVGGVDVPLTASTTLTFNGGYNFFFDREFDFEGVAFTVQWRKYFKGPSRFENRATERKIR